jgi:hypothetical protein
MRATAVMFIYALALTGCGTMTCKTDAPDVHVAPECLQSCAESLATGDLGSAFVACDARRKLCVEAINRAKSAKAIQ